VLAEATHVVALANIGLKLRRPALVHKSRIKYSKMLRSLQSMISKQSMAKATESLMTAVLLGLYEVCITPRMDIQGQFTNNFIDNYRN